MTIKPLEPQIGMLIETVSRIIMNEDTDLFDDKPEFFLLTDIEYVQTYSKHNNWFRIRFLRQNTLERSWISDYYFKLAQLNELIKLVHIPEENKSDG